MKTKIIAVSTAIASTPGLGLRIARTYFVLQGILTAYDIESGEIMQQTSSLSKIFAAIGIGVGTAYTIGFNIRRFLERNNYPDPIWWR